MSPYDWMKAILEGLTVHLQQFLQYNWSALLLLSGVFVILVVMDQRWLLLDKVASFLGAVLAAIYRGTKESGLPVFWWPLLIFWVLIALPFFLTALVIALIVNGLAALFRFVSRRMGITLNAA